MRSNLSHYPIGVALLTVFILLVVPYSAATSGLGWAGVVESENTMGTTVTYGPNGDILASGHKNSVLISNAVTQEVMQEILVDFTVETIEFSSDSKYMVVGMTSELPNTPGSVVFELIDGQYERGKHTEDGKNVDTISVSPDNTVFATATEDGAIAEWFMDSGTGSNVDLYLIYPPTHEGHINCIDHSLDGVHILSGADDGDVILWDRNNQTEIIRWETNEPIADCTFSPDGNTMAWISGGSLFLRNYDDTFSYAGQFDIHEQSSQIEFSPITDIMGILVDVISESPRHIEFVNVSNVPFFVESRLYLPHQSLVFSLHPTMNRVAVSTNSEYVAIYADSIHYETEIPSSIDTDQDNIPDEIDDDDDGDGISDWYDNICASGNNCNLKPDPEYMRNIRIDIIGNQITIRDTIHLDGAQSAYIRQLVSDSVSSPTRVDQSEYDDYLLSMCSEYSASEVKSRWNAHLHLNNSEFLSVSVECKIDYGLYGTTSSDTGTRISISWIITGVATTSLNAPYNLTITNNLQLPSSSIAQVVHTFPLRVEVNDAGGMNYVHEIWNRRDADLEIEVVIPPEPEPSDVESLIDTVVTYWYVLFLTIICIGSIVFTIAIRRSNRIDFSVLDGLEERDYDEDWENMVDDVAAWDEDMELPVEKKSQPKPPKAVEKDIKRKPKPPAAVRADLMKDNDLIKSKRKTRKITKVENVENNGDTEDPIDFKHLIQKSSKINTGDQENDQDAMEDALSFITSESASKTKKRRPVRRKKSGD